MKKIFDKTFFLYVALGFVNYFACSAVMLLFKNVVRLSETACLIIAFALQTAVSFALNRYVTFRGIKISKWWPLKFLLSIAVCYLGAKVLLRDAFAALLRLPLLQSAAVWLYGVFGGKVTYEAFQINLIMLACTFTYCMINYVGQRYFVFRPVKEAS